MKSTVLFNQEVLVGASLPRVVRVRAMIVRCSAAFGRGPGLVLQVLLYSLDSGLPSRTPKNLGKHFEGLYYFVFDSTSVGGRSVKACKAIA